MTCWTWDLLARFFGHIKNDSPEIEHGSPETDAPGSLEIPNLETRQASGSMLKFGGVYSTPNSVFFSRWWIPWDRIRVKKTFGTCSKSWNPKKKHAVEDAFPDLDFQTGGF